MGKKQKRVFIVSLLVNALLIVCVVIGYLQMNLVHKELFYSEVQHKLVELDGLIEHQKENDWSEPNLVTTQLGDVLNGLNVATNSGKYSGWLQNDEQMTMELLDNALRQYPHDELYQFSVLTQRDKNDFEELQSKLQNVGFGMKMAVSRDWKTFIHKTETLLALLENN